MLRDITLGQYYPVQSKVHKLDPRVKIIAAVLFVVEIFIVNEYTGFLVCAAGLAVCVGMSKVPISYIFKGMRPIVILLLFTVLLNLFMMDGEVVWRFGFLKVTDKGIDMAFFMAVRLILLIIGTSLLTYTTTPVALTDGLERLFSPLKAIGFPTHELAMMMSIALRFIPTLLDETDKIIKAQQARGADFESGNIFTRARSLVPILVPLFVSAFRIASDLAMAMEARCYRGGKGRTRMNGMKFTGFDTLCLIMIFLFLGLVILERIFL